MYARGETRVIYIIEMCMLRERRSNNKNRSIIIVVGSAVTIAAKSDRQVGKQKDSKPIYSL